MQLTWADARNLGPRRAAAYMRENLSAPEQMTELQQMLLAGGSITNLAHGIAVELQLTDRLEPLLVESLKMSPRDLAVGYGGQVQRNVTERSPHAGHGPLYARLPGTGPVDDE
ncbi:MAG: hypothetical protein ACO3JL_14420 [Myxococcota bacterium]